MRHAPWEYELELDENGWVSVEQLLHALHQSIEWRDVKIEDLKIMIEKSEKKRHELK
ncbi:RNA 2'-phosphotransferase, partial [Bacillus wiedmannii]|uniref:RNA 2'-phosphotransferase n=1 Tax=Bacillus wiedmannii TaxID=1890302 RepID=UPI003F6D328C